MACRLPTAIFKLLWSRDRGFPVIAPSLEVAHFSDVQSLGVGLSLADLDGDGTLDIISLARINSDRLRLEIYWNDGAGGFADRHFSEVRSAAAFASSPPMLSSGDFDNDGREDVLPSGSQPV